MSINLEELSLKIATVIESNDLLDIDCSALDYVESIIYGASTTDMIELRDIIEDYTDDGIIADLDKWIYIDD